MTTSDREKERKEERKKNETGAEVNKQCKTESAVGKENNVKRCNGKKKKESIAKWFRASMLLKLMHERHNAWPAEGGGKF